MEMVAAEANTRVAPRRCLARITSQASVSFNSRIAYVGLPAPIKIRLAYRRGLIISGSSGLKAEPRLRAGTRSMTGLKFCKRVLKKPPTRNATSAELSSKPAGVSIMATRNGSEMRRAKDSKIRPPAREVSPDPRKAIRPRVISHRCRVEFVYYVQQGFIGRNIRHGISIMNETNMTFRIYDTVQRHASQLNEVDFLFIEPRNFMLRVGQANEGNIFIFPKTLKLLRFIRPNCQNDHTAFSELLVFITQARQLRATVRSHKSAQKIKYDASAAKLG